MGEKERPSGANHSEQAESIQDSIPPVSSTHASTRNDERVSMSPHAEAEVFDREQHSTQTQPTTIERDASSVDIGEYRRLKEQVRALTVERNELREENSQLRESLKELRELREKEEHRKEQQRKRAEKWRKEHPETHRAREKERKRKLRAEAARNQQPTS